MRKKLSGYIVPIGGILLFCAVLLWFVTAVNSAGSAGESGRLEAVKRSVENAVTLCYSIEGSYPEDLDYLAENYGVHYDKNLYVIHYECFASNIRPSVSVAQKGA